MSRCPNFLGGYDVGRSPNSVDAQIVNLYLEVVENQDGKSPGAFYMTPGLDLFATCGAGPINGIYPFNGSLHAVSDNSAYIVAPNGTVTANGTIGSTPITQPVSFISMAGEGEPGPTQSVQLAVFTGNGGYLSTGAGFLPIALPDTLTKPITADGMDTFGLVNQQGTNVWWQSNSLDLSTWDPLNFTFADALPSNVVALKMFRRQMWLFKTDSLEIWADQGLSGFAFARLDGPFSHYGCAAAFSPALVGDSIVWLSANTEGPGQILKATNYQPLRISNHAIERQIQSYGKISDAFAYSYQQEGHIFYVITFPSANATWVYDDTASNQLGIPIWHQRAAFNTSTGQFDRHQGNCYAFFNGMHLIGDWRSGNIYSMNLNTLLDNGAQRKWLRTFRATPQPSTVPRKFDALSIDMQTGIGVPPDSNPRCGLRWSDDGGHTWSNQVLARVGALGKTGKRVKFNRLGSTTYNRGLDRIFELSSTDQFSVGLVGADISP